MVGLFTPVPLYVAGIVYAIYHRACCRCCCPNETERVEKEAQKQELREKRALRRQAREQKKLKKQNKKERSTETSNGMSEEKNNAEQLSLMPIASTETITGECNMSNNGTPLVDQHSNDNHEKNEMKQGPTVLSKTQI